MAAVAVFGFTVNAQEFKLGANLGLPIGDADTAYSFNLGADVSALWDVSETFKVGATAGLSYSLVKSDYSDFLDAAIFLPIAGAARFNASDEFTIGLDLGYALGLNEGNDGGFYYAPKVQYGISESLDIVAAYRGVSLDGWSFNVITLGIEFGL